VLLRHTIRAGRVAVGLALIAIGVVLAIPGVPGPGLLVIFGGLTLLAAEFSWAERLRDRMRETVQRLTRRGNG
jgi:hypothetical protein